MPAYRMSVGSSFHGCHTPIAWRLDACVIAHVASDCEGYPKTRGNLDLHVVTYNVGISSSILANALAALQCTQCHHGGGQQLHVVK